jgi:asparagine synthase (glutamine-hydrolysing)
MCGIVGFMSEKKFPSLKQELPEAVSRLTHRGPDDAGIYFDEEAGVGLAHRRLSVIDLSRAGRQPMKSNDESVYAVYNGEVYNFREIRKTLAGHGHQFNTSTDTEVILKAYQHWGTECFVRFVGMFALALWDGQKRCLYLARDRLGIKPLYYFVNDGIFLFASEMKALMAMGDFPRDLDYDSIPLYLHYQYIPAPRTIFRNTFKLLPGHFAVFGGGVFELHPYWNLSEGDSMPLEANVGEEEIFEELDRILTEAVDGCLISDVALGALLSGGIDSSLVVALMQKVSSTPVRTFSVGFEEESFDEAPWAARVASHLRTDHTELYVTAREAVEVIPRLPEIYDEPFGDPSAIPTYLVSRIARSYVKVALSGDGGDELFCGYVRYWTTMAIYETLRKLPRAALELLLLLLKNLPPAWVERCYLPIRDNLPQTFQVTNFQEKWRKLLSVLSGPSNVAELYRMTISQWDPTEIMALTGRMLQTGQYEDLFRKSEGRPILSRLMLIDQRTYLPDAMLTKVDRASMAVSLEVRVPFLDHRVVEYSSILSDSLKYRNGRGKYLLRKLLARYLPINLFERPKMGLGVPIDRWLRAEIKDLLMDYLSPGRLKREGLFDRAAVEKILVEHFSGKANHQYRLWYLLMWEMWRERWLDG